MAKSSKSGKPGKVSSNLKNVYKGAAQAKPIFADIKIKPVKPKKGKI